MAKRPYPFFDHNPISRSLSESMESFVLESFISLQESSPLSIDLSFNRILESKALDSDRIALIESAILRGSDLLEAGKRSLRKRASNHNSIVWSLPPDLTSRVFSMLDGQTLSYASVACSMFNKCAMDPLCYVNLDLTTAVPKVNNGVVLTMINRAGKLLQSLKLGIIPGLASSSGSSPPLVYDVKSSVDASGFSWNDKRKRQRKESSILTRNCLLSLSVNNGAVGARLRRLHLYNIERLDSTALFVALSACPSLIDLVIIGLNVELSQTLTLVSTNCQLIERLLFESSKTGRDDSLGSPICVDLVNKCPHVCSLALKGFKLQDYKARYLVKGFHKLKYVDFSTSYSLNGTFLKNLSADLLEVLILRDCIHLKEMEVARFLTDVLGGDFKLLRHLDISNKEGLASQGDWYNRCYSSRIIPFKQVLEQRPHMCILAEFPSEGSFIDADQMIDSDGSSENSSTSQFNSSHTSDSSMFVSSSASYNSDQGSGNESSEEVDFMMI